MAKNIMIVDDEPQIRKLYALAFQGAGYSVECADSAEASIEMLKNSPASVFFLDLNLPGVDGVSLCKIIHTQRPMSVIYAVTGYASLFELWECREAGFEDYFIKPVRLSMLIQAAEHAFMKQHRWRKR